MQCLIGYMQSNKSESTKSINRISKCIYLYLSTPSVSIGVAKSSEENLDSDFTGLRRSNLHILYDQWLVGLPRNSSFIRNPNRSKNPNHKRFTNRKKSHKIKRTDRASTFASDHLTLSSHGCERQRKGER